MFGILSTPRIRLKPEATMKRMTVLLRPTSTWQRTPGEQMKLMISNLEPPLESRSYFPRVFKTCSHVGIYSDAGIVTRSPAMRKSLYSGLFFVTPQNMGSVT